MQARKPACERYAPTVGLNPFRPQARRRSDYVMVAAALGAIGVMLLWALIPR